MTTINTIEDLARILREQPTWAEAMRSLLLTQELLDLPARFDRFVEIQQETNQLTARRLNAIEERLDGLEGRMGNIEGRMGNIEGSQCERGIRNRAINRTRTVLGLESPRVVMHQEGMVDPQLNSAVERALQDGRVPRGGCDGLLEADLVISGRDNRHAVIEVSITADADDITRARERAGVMALVTGGTVTPVVITSRLDPAQSAQAEVEGVRVFVIPYP